MQAKTTYKLELILLKNRSPEQRLVAIKSGFSLKKVHPRSEYLSFVARPGWIFI